ncbi:MAG: hypothetical protein MUE56_03610 [Ignavibacteria bacterium]|jgi:photosystem II stability/assembly factor-like uncharacterized protein|nr:hypothetical protein [Ignavibacteria bacterium]
MKSVFVYPVIILIFSFTVISCSDESEPVSTQPPVAEDTTEFSNLTSRLPGWAYDYGLYDIEVIRNKMWLSCDNDNCILISQDSGMTFTKINTNGKIVPNMQIMPDGLTGFLYDSALLKTADGGLTWDSVGINVKKITGLQFLNPNYGVLAGCIDTAKFLTATSNGGVNWTYKAIWLGNSNIIMTSLCVPDTLDPSVIYIGSDRGLFFTTNAGTSWRKVTFTQGDPHILRLVYWKRGSFCVSGRNGFLYSNTGGYWTRYMTNNFDYITAVSTSYGGGLIMAPANDRFYVYMSADSGKTMKQKIFGRNITGSLNGAKVISDSAAYFIGDNSLFFSYRRK